MPLLHSSPVYMLQLKVHTSCMYMHNLFVIKNETLVEANQDMNEHLQDESWFYKLSTVNTNNSSQRCWNRAFYLEFFVAVLLL